MAVLENTSIVTITRIISVAILTTSPPYQIDNSLIFKNLKFTAIPLALKRVLLNRFNN